LWIDKAKQAYEDLKQVVTHAPVLILPDFSFVLKVGASSMGIGAI